MFFLLQHINQWALDCESLSQRMSALEEHIEQLNDRMRELEVKLEENYLLLSRQQSTSTDEGTDPDCLTPPYPQLVENCCAPSIFLYGELEYECPRLSACPLHQDSTHTQLALVHNNKKMMMHLHTTTSFVWHWFSCHCGTFYRSCIFTINCFCCTESPSLAWQRCRLVRNVASCTVAVQYEFFPDKMIILFTLYP